MSEKIINKKADLAFKDLLSRQDYLVVQANDLARAFGNLTSFEHKVLDYCFSFVTKDSIASDEYIANALDIIHQLGLNASGQNYKRVAKAFKALNENTALYFKIKREDGKSGILMTQLFSRISFFQDGQIRFKFSEDAAPYVYDLREHYYSFKLSELSHIKSKYSLILMKLWQSHKMDKLQTSVNISGSLDDWESWFLGQDKTWPAGRFVRDALTPAMNELSEKLNFWFTLTKQKRGRRIVGYDLTIHSANNRKEIN